jgi:hypothetical protein
MCAVSGFDLKDRVQGSAGICLHGAKPIHQLRDYSVAT